MLKSEVIRRAVEEASKQEELSPRLTPMQALERLMSTPSKMKPGEADRFAEEVRKSRHASGRKRGAMLDRAWKKYKKGSAKRLVRFGLKLA